VRQYKMLLLAFIMSPGGQLFAQTGNAIPAWQTAAGGKMELEVASIRLNPGKFVPPNFPIGNDDAYADTGGLMRGDFPLYAYITFAYKIRPSQSEREAILAHLPKWVSTDNYEIHAKAALPNPTKDQMRLMMQSLLRDRFGLVVHFETREADVLAMTLTKPGRLGTNLHPHADGPSCDVTAEGWVLSAKPNDAKIYPPTCYEYHGRSLPNHGMEWGMRNVTTALMAESFTGFASDDRPVVDETGLVGRYDFVIDWTPEQNHTTADTLETSAPQGTAFMQALQEQLGLKLKPAKAPLRELVVEQVARPSEN